MPCIVSQFLEHSNGYQKLQPELHVWDVLVQEEQGPLGSVPTLTRLEQTITFDLVRFSSLGHAFKKNPFQFLFGVIKESITLSEMV